MRARMEYPEVKTEELYMGQRHERVANGLPACHRKLWRTSEKAQWSLVLITSLIMFFLECQMAWAGAIRIYDQSASGTGQANAVAAQADDPSALYYNPSGITQLRGVQLSIGTLLVGGHTNYTSPTGATTTGTFSGSVASPPPSNFYVTANLKDLGVKSLGDLTVGVGVLSPFGLLYQYPDTAPFATAATRQLFQLVDIKPTIAYRVNDWLSVGAGADIYTFTSLWGTGRSVTNFKSSGGPGLPPAGSNVEINGSDTAAGFNVSLLATPLRNADGKPLANVGLIYRSQATLHLDGDFLVHGGRVAGASTTVVLPRVITGAVALWPVRDATHEWKLELDVDFTGWKSVRNLDVHLSNGANIPFAENWRNTYTIMVGTEYKWLNPAWLPAWDAAARGGYYHSQTPIPDASFIPTIPDADLHGISLGLGVLCKAGGRFFGLVSCGDGTGRRFGLKGIGLDLAYQALLYETRTVTGNQNPIAIPGVVDGTYQTILHVASVNLRLAF